MQTGEKNRTDPVAAVIRDVRAELGASQTKFAGMLGVKQPTVAQLENGRRRPSPRMAYRLAQVSGKPLETFVAAYYERVTQ